MFRTAPKGTDVACSYQQYETVAPARELPSLTVVQSARSGLVEGRVQRIPRPLFTLFGSFQRSISAINPHSFDPNFHLLFLSSLRFRPCCFDQCPKFGDLSSARGASSLQAGYQISPARGKEEGREGQHPHSKLALFSSALLADPFHRERLRLKRVGGRHRRRRCRRRPRMTSFMNTMSVPVSPSPPSLIHHDPARRKPRS